MDSSFYSSKFLKRQIEELNLLVKVVFVGDNFAKVVNYLENQSEVVQVRKDFFKNAQNQMFFALPKIFFKLWRQKNFRIFLIFIFTAKLLQLM